MKILRRINKKFTLTGVLSLLVGGVLVFAPAARATVPYINSLVSVDSSGALGNTLSDRASVSRDGKYVAFSSAASNLVSGDTNGLRDIFLRNIGTGATTRVSVSTGGNEANAASWFSKVSYDGRYVVFSSTASNLVSSDSNDYYDVFLRDTVNGTTELISQATAGTQGNQWSGGDSGLDISRDGRFVVFSAAASNLVAGDTGNRMDVFVRDRKLNTTTMLSVSASGTQGNGDSQFPAISCEGTHITFNSSSTNLVPSDTNGATDVFYVDRLAGFAITNITTAGNDVSGGSSISCSGEIIGYTTAATNLVSGDTNNRLDVLAYDVNSATTELISKSTSGALGNDNSSFPSVSADGRYVSFQSSSYTLATNSNSLNNAYMRDRIANTTVQITKRNATNNVMQNAERPAISGNGRYVVYDSGDTGLVSGDTNGVADVFMSETGITDLSL
jgi:hypothetical protein